MRLRPLRALCPVLGCLAFSFGCGQAGVEAGAGDEIEGPEIGPSTTQQGAGEEGALVGTAGDDVVWDLGETTRSTAARIGSTAGPATT